MAILPVGIGPQEGGYQIERSLRFNSADSAYLSRTPASAGNRKTWTWSGWVKRSALSANQVLFSATNVSDSDRLTLVSDNTIGFFWQDTLQGSVSTTAVFRDVSAWYHLVVIHDTTQATAANRLKIYINGVAQTKSTDSPPAQNHDGAINNTVLHTISRADARAVQYLDGYLSEVNFIDGQALDPTSFGEYNSNTGVWQPKAYTGSYGTNGFYLDFSDNSGTTSTTLGKDYSGNANNWTPNNFSVTAGAGNDSLVDTPTNYGTDTGVGAEVRGNYATWNPLDKDDGISSVTEGNLKVVTNGSNGSIKSTIAFPSGKWYWEVTSDSVNSGGTQAVGIMPQSQPPTNNMSDSGKLGYALDVSFSDRKFENGTATSYGSYTQANGAVYMLAFDQDAGKLWYGVNGTWLASGNPAAGTNPSSSSISTSTAYCAAVSDNTVSGTFTVNFGQRPFAYTAPSGFKALCTQNLPDPAIADGSTVFNVVTWSGAGASSGSVTGVGFQPDFVWAKVRSTAYSHVLYDAVRGTGKSLLTDTTLAEISNDPNGYISSFDSDGFSSLSGGTNYYFNQSGQTYVAWNWKAGGTGVSNTAGSITSTVSANTTAGFSIISYTGNGTTGATVGHGLGAAPKFIIWKPRASVSDWMVWHIGLSGYNYDVRLNTTAAQGTGADPLNNTAPSSTVITLRNQGDVNGSGASIICYAFAPVAGYSAFGKYTGNGSTDGPFVYTGFRPRWIMTKRTDGIGDWNLWDTSRSPYNQGGQTLWSNLSNAEYTAGIYYDVLSNGFKLKDGNADSNANGGTYIYAAFAENAFKVSLGR